MTRDAGTDAGGGCGADGVGGGRGDAGGDPGGAGGLADTLGTVARGAGLWARSAAREIRADPRRGSREAARSFYTGLWRLYGMGRNYGDPIYETEWDLLIVLDACRADLLAEVADDYPFLDAGVADSLGSCSPEWMAKNFTAEYAAEMAGTAHVTGNPYSRAECDPDDFALLDEVWRTAWDEQRGTIHPHALTDRAIQVGREHDPDRLLVHYMQPHHPFVPRPLGAGADTDLDGVAFGEDDSVWNQLRRGAVDRETVWAAYRANLEYVLDSVAVLLENVDAERAVITADHGNALGEHHMYGHPAYAPVPALKRVPWCETTATDTRSREPVADAEGAPGPDRLYDDRQGDDRPGVDDEVAAKLRDLGYA